MYACTWLPGHGDETKTFFFLDAKGETKTWTTAGSSSSSLAWLCPPPISYRVPTHPYAKGPATAATSSSSFQDIPSPLPSPLYSTEKKRNAPRRRTALLLYSCSSSGEAPRYLAPRIAPARSIRDEIKTVASRIEQHRQARTLEEAKARGGGDGGGVPRGGGVRLPVQGGADRGQRRGQVEPAVALRQGRVQPRHQVHHRRRVRHQDRPRRRQARQGADLGHRRPGKVPSHHQRLLPRSSGRAGGVRRDAAHHVRERGAVADGAAGPHGRQHRGDAGREQGGPAAPARRVAGGGQSLRGAAPHLLHGDVGAGGHQRGGRLHGGARRDLPRREQEGAGHRRRPGRAAQGQDHRRRRQGRRLPRQHGRLLLGLVASPVTVVGQVRPRARRQIDGTLLHSHVAIRWLIIGSNLERLGWLIYA